MKENRLTIIVFLIFALILAATGYQLRSTPEVERVRLPLVQGCPLQLQACSAKLPSGGKFEFEISPKTPSTTETLYLNAHFKQTEPEAVRVIFEGKDMYMGFLEYDLKRQDNYADSVLFAGKGGLSICILDVMPWIVLLNVKVDNIIYEIPFEFETLRVQ